MSLPVVFEPAPNAEAVKLCRALVHALGLERGDDGLDRAGVVETGAGAIVDHAANRAEQVGQCDGQTSPLGVAKESNGRLECSHTKLYMSMYTRYASIHVGSM